MTYLTEWRLELGAEALRSTSRSVQRVALDVGYESEAAFNRAFKRRFAMPPAKYRREARAQSATLSRQEGMRAARKASHA
jgi:transcriptional regulator GlxA family with amidase domain